MLYIKVPSIHSLLHNEVNYNTRQVITDSCGWWVFLWQESTIRCLQNIWSVLSGVWALRDEFDSKMLIWKLNPKWFSYIFWYFNTITNQVLNTLPMVTSAFRIYSHFYLIYLVQNILQSEGLNSLYILYSSIF